MSSIWLHLSQIRGTDKAPGRRHDALGPRGEGDPHRYRIIKFVVGYFELRSSDRRYYSGPLLKDRGITSLTVVGGSSSYRVERAPRHVTFTTAQDSNVLLNALFSAALNLRF